MSETRKKKRAKAMKPLDAPRKKRSAVGPAAGLALVLALVLALGILLPEMKTDAVRSAFASRRSAFDGVRLNEVMASNGVTLSLADGSQPDWIELKNVSGAEVWLGGYALMSGDDATQMYRFPAMAIGAGETLLLYADNGVGRGDELHVPFRISSAGENLKLLDATGAEVDAVTTPRLERDEAYARAADGTWQVTSVATPGAENEILAPGSAEALARDVPMQSNGAVVITEVMSKTVTYARDRSGRAADYIELTNVSSASVNLEGWRLTDDKLNLAKWMFPAVTLGAGECLLVYCTGIDKRDDPSDLHASFRLAGEGESVILTNREGAATSMVAVPPLNADQAYSLVDGRWTDQLSPTPGAANTQTNAWAMGDAVLSASGSPLRISELSACSVDERPDWIELYNAGAENINLSGYALSDNPKNPQKWRFPQGMSIAPGEYVGVFCSGKDRNEDGWQHTNFKLSSAGGFCLVLSREGTGIVDRVFVPRQYEGVTYGRVSGRQGFYFFAGGSPLSANNGVAYDGKLSAPEYSVAGGLFETGDSFSVALTSVPGAQIFYTLDCTEPDQTSSLYTGPIAVNGTTILRTRVYRQGYLESYTDTQSYLYDVHTEPGVYIVSLVSDPDGLTSDERGIMVKGTGDRPNYRQNWEREASFELFTADGKTAVSQECGISLHGGGSRELPIKSFNVIARNRYGQSRFDYPIFSERPYTSYKSVLLRPSGEDYCYSFMRDSLLTSLMGDSSLLYQKWELSVVYLNGQYYTLDYIRERLTVDTICLYEGWEGMEDDIDLVREETVAVSGSNASFKELLAWCKKNDTSTEAAYEYLGSQIDIQNYIEYMTAEIYTGNTDLLNVRRYRNAKADGKWRWMLYDLDWAFFNDTNSLQSWMDPRGAGARNAADTTLFRACMANPRFRDEFLTYFGQMVATNFSTENVLARIQERWDLLSPFLDEYRTHWKTQLDSGLGVLTKYAKERPEKIIRYFQSVLNLSNEELERYFGDAIRLIKGEAAGQ